MASIAAAVFKKTRVIGFGLLWFLIALLSTSALPLAEVMNDHRTFLPYIGLVIAMAGAVSLLVNRDVRYSLWAKVAADCHGRTLSVRKRLRHISTQQSLEHRRDALAGRDDQKSAQPARIDELRQHAHGKRRF